MRRRLQSLMILLYMLVSIQTAYAQPADYVWNSQSKNAAESMPCGGGSVGMNVWVEKGDLLFYLTRSGSFDENNTLLKQGRFRIRLGNGLSATDFKQVLKVNDGNIVISDRNNTINLWADVFNPVVHIEITGKQDITAQVYYESWRYKDRPINKSESFQTSYKFGVPDGTCTRKDVICSDRNGVTFYHANADSTVFDATVTQQDLKDVKGDLYNPLGNLIFGGRLTGNGLKYMGTTDGIYHDTDYRAWYFQTEKATRKLNIDITLATCQGTYRQWKTLLDQSQRQVRREADRKASRNWWHQYWQRSFIEGKGACKEYTDNYTLFRYMMGCNAKSEWPTKFNGGLFCFDPSYVLKDFNYTPDYRRWGGGTHTAQNQRLLYWPMLKSGDYDILEQQLQFYLRILRNAELRSQHYWHHGGGCFTEQIENFGLPEYNEYGKERPDYFDKGMQYNAWLEYTWDTVLEFCEMAFESERYAGTDISQYIPLVCSSLDFFDQHYRYLARMRSIKETDAEGKLILYPGSGAETFKMAYNSTSTIAALKTVTKSLLAYFSNHGPASAQIKKYEKILRSIPDINFREIDGHKVISPAIVWSRLSGSEATMLYPVYPWRIYGVGRPDLQVALDTWNYEPFVKNHAGYVSWEQTNIWAACLGLTDTATEYLKKKLGNGPYRFPAFWGPGHDWTPDHNWGGSGQIGLQEMLLQEVDDKIILLPAWPKYWDVHFKLHAHGNTTVEVDYSEGKVKKLTVIPSDRAKDVDILPSCWQSTFLAK